MPVIKASNPRVERAVPFNLADIEAYAKSLLIRARGEADRLLKLAQTESDSIKAQAKAEGLALGKKEGLAQGKTEGIKQGKTQAFEAEKKRISELITTLAELVVAMNEHRQELIDRADAEVLPLSLAISKKVCKRLGNIDPRVVEANVKEAIRLVTAKHDLRLRINPAQKQTLTDLLPLLKQLWPVIQHVELVDDTTISPGGCRVCTAGGEIDAELDTQLDRIARELIPDPDSLEPAPES